MAKRITRSSNQQEEADRVAERLFNTYGKQITDEESFNFYLNKLWDQAEYTSEQKSFARTVQKEYEKSHVIRKASTPAQERQQREITKQRTRKRKREKTIPAERYQYGGISKGKVVKAARTQILKKDKYYQVYRDNKGRFVSRRIPKN